MVSLVQAIGWHHGGERQGTDRRLRAGGPDRGRRPGASLPRALRLRRPPLREAGRGGRAQGRPHHGRGRETAPQVPGAGRDPAPPLPHQHRQLPRLLLLARRRMGRSPVPRHGTARGRVARRPPQEGGDGTALAPGRGDFRAVPGGADPRARTGRHPPRHQTIQHLPHERRPHQADRLRHRAPRRQRADEHRRLEGNLRLHGPRFHRHRGLSRRRGLGHLQPRRLLLPGAHRFASVRAAGRDRAHRLPQPLARRRPSRPLFPPRRLPRPEPGPERGRQEPRRGARRALPLLCRDAGGLPQDPHPPPAPPEQG